MKSLFLPALLLFAVACGKSTVHETAKVSSGLRAEVGVVETVYEVLEEMARTRVGFVNKTSYDSGRIVYWVYGPGYREKMGYLLANVRRVLGHDKVVVLEPIDQKELAKQLLKGRYDKPKADDKAGCGCGCGDE